MLMQYSIHLYVSLYSSNVKSISFITNSFIQTKHYTGGFNDETATEISAFNNC
ncbi:protein of unknown function [Lactiplantibacillus plantarum]